MCGLYWLMGYNVIVSTWINYSFNINEKMNLFVIPLTHRHNTTLIPLLVPTQVMSAQEGLAWPWSNGHDIKIGSFEFFDKYYSKLNRKKLQNGIQNCFNSQFQNLFVRNIKVSGNLHGFGEG